ncbi:hypothetical protein [Leptospira sp. P2653]|uniref:Uncharacterized protein n=1 Tax=Leptospira weilii str. 2006001855 TaxID=996804 RepID=M6FFP2_9LEPT|nr:hypothetical protein [Leptospira sp. P2653]EMJ67207.1 hypothetical protein LEP1GSC051_0878 [Leptospira sp. P2653]EMM71568.1 hypothetical protein LEP1GSC038_0366 [Leptospira weilii str. 2006001855]
MKIEEILKEFGDKGDTFTTSTVQYFLDNLYETTELENQKVFLRNLSYQFYQLKKSEYISDFPYNNLVRHLCHAILNAINSDSIKSFSNKYTADNFKIKSIENTLVYRDGGSIELVVLTESLSEVAFFLGIDNKDENNDPSYNYLFPCEGYKIYEYWPIVKDSAEDIFIYSEIKKAMNEKRLSPTGDFTYLDNFIEYYKKRLK